MANIKIGLELLWKSQGGRSIVKLVQSLGRSVQKFRIRSKSSFIFLSLENPIVPGNFFLVKGIKVKNGILEH